MKSDLSIRLRTLRKSLSMTPMQVVSLLKKNDLSYSEQSLYKWEEGSVIPKLDTLSALSKIYKCDLSYLVEGRQYKYLRITPCEYNLLNVYRTNFLFRSVLTQIIRRIHRR